MYVYICMFVHVCLHGIHVHLCMYIFGVFLHIFMYLYFSTVTGACVTFYMSHHVYVCVCARECVCTGV